MNFHKYHVTLSKTWAIKYIELKLLGICFVSES